MYVVKRPEPLRFVIFLALLAAAILYVSATWGSRGATGATAGGTVASGASEPGTALPGEMLVTAPDTLGSTGDDFYVAARLSRERARADEADILQAMVDDPQATADERDAAASRLVTLARRREMENMAETILKAKGYRDAIVLLGDGGATVILSTEGLADADVARAAAAVARATGVSDEDVNVVARP